MLNAIKEQQAEIETLTRSERRKMRRFRNSRNKRDCCRSSSVRWQAWKEDWHELESTGENSFADAMVVTGVTS